MGGVPEVPEVPKAREVLGVRRVLKVQRGRECKLLRIQAGMNEDLRLQAAARAKQDDQRTSPVREPHLVRGSVDYEDMLDRLSKGVHVTIERKHA